MTNAQFQSCDSPCICVQLQRILEACKRLSSDMNHGTPCLSSLQVNTSSFKDSSMKVMDNLEDQRSQEWTSIIHIVELSIRTATRNHIRDGAVQPFQFIWEEIGFVVLTALLTFCYLVWVSLEIGLEIHYPNAIQYHIHYPFRLMSLFYQDHRLLGSNNMKHHLRKVVLWGMNMQTHTGPHWMG